MNHIVNNNKPVRLIRFIVLMMTLFLFYGCKNNNEIELRIKKRECIHNLEINKQVISSLIRYGQGSTNERYLAAKRGGIYIDSMRGLYNKSLNRRDLLAYSDSVVSRNNKLEDKEDMSTIEDLLTMRKKILTADSSDILSFYYLTLLVERDLLISYARELPSDWPLDPISFLVSDHFLLGDTVTLLVRTLDRESDLWVFDFSDIKCKNEATGKIIEAYQVKIGPNYLFYYRPKEKGNYKISGKVRVFTYGEWKTFQRIKHQFVVE